jgi:hypothetical protein
VFILFVSFQKQEKEGLGCSLVVQRLPSMLEALGSIPAPKKKKENEKEGMKEKGKKEGKSSSE